MDLNPAQNEAVNTLSGPLLVLAGAGTGKTRVVTYRIAKLIQHRTRPERILAVTFTNKAADEMLERATTLLSKHLKQKPEISTFHSLCVRVLRRHIQRLGYPSAFAIYDRGDQESVARDALREIRVADAVLRPGDLLAFISRWKTASIRPEQAAAQAQTDKEHLGAAAYRRYQTKLKNAGAVDFDDLLLCTEDLFAHFPDVRQTEADRFDHLLIDEYQDTNRSQYRIVKALASGHRNLCVVGDDDQSIYGWRGAEVAHILGFKKDWPEAKVIRLEDNYRSTREIIAWANRLIAFNKIRHGKQLRAFAAGDIPRILQLKDESEEAETVVGEIATRIQLKKSRPRDFAILCRTNEQPRAFEMELRRAKVPYVLIGGMSFYDRKEVRDVLAYLKLLTNPRDDVSLLRIVNVPARGIGQTTVQRLLAQAVGLGRPVWDVLKRVDQVQGLSAPAQGACQKFHALIEQLQKQLDPLPPVEALRGILRHVDYQSELTRLYPDPNEQQTRWASVEEVVNAAALYGNRASRPSLAGFLHEIALTGNDDAKDKESKLQRDAVVLMTLHAAKGLEFPEVYMVGLEEGVLPHRRSIDDGSTVDEERRLCYVGVTRAKCRLTLTMALTRQKWGKPRPTLPSRFLYELTGQADNPKYLESVRGKQAHPVHPPKPHTAADHPAGRPGASPKPTRRPKRT